MILNTWLLLGESQIVQDKKYMLVVYCMASNVQIVNYNGNVNYNNCNWNDYSVRPFWFGRRNRVSNVLKLESQYQKSKQPFLRIKAQDKYKGMRFYDKR